MTCKKAKKPATTKKKPSKAEIEAQKKKQAENMSKAVDIAEILTRF